MSRACFPPLFLAVLLCASHPCAVLAVDLISPVSQDRHLFTSALAVDDALPASDQDADSLVAPDFGPFVGTVSSNAAVVTATASSSSSQDSQFLADSMDLMGSMSATADTYDYEASGHASGESHCEVTFDVAATASFTLSGTLSAAGHGSVTVDLDGPGGPIVALSSVPDQTTPVLETGLLPPGTYTLVIHGGGSAFASYFVRWTAEAGFDLLFSVTPATSAPSTGEWGAPAAIAMPNPFRESTRISLQHPGAAPLEASIHDSQGRLVRSLRSSNGSGAVRWDGRDDAGRPVVAGTYFYSVRAGELRRTGKVVLLR